MTERILKTILLVEDEPDIQMIASMSLEMVGNFEVHVCGSGKEALDKVNQINPDLILLDVMMPEMDGPTTLREMRAMPSMRHTPIVFLTAKVQSQEIAEYKALGAIGVIQKPFDPMTLGDEVRKIWRARVS